ncbi:Beta-glucanase [Escovopsis weberi]|uniref:Beta-glucanase n=1 Tax=Escovopsis weberi TaxID=150374 RepID=A0A0M8MSN4_ESCWE|nr:Beta-glucanase [Escovopsis weberi]
MAFGTRDFRYRKSAGGLLVLLLALAPRFASAVCECGYVVNNTDQGPDPWLFTESIESNFKQVKNIATNSDWQREQFNVSAEAGRGPYGRSFLPGNIDIISAAKASANGGSSNAGLEMRVGGNLVNDAVTTAEIDTARHDLFYGSYRAGMKMTDVNGTCAAFFWYFNDTQEIDMEFLSRQFDRENNIYPVNLVIQSRASAEAGFDAAGTDTFKQVNLTFDPSADFHEYRFDFFENRVFFYADSQLLAAMNGSAIPTTAGHLILQHWSNGNALWSGGPPTEDAFLSVSYVKAYFNSTDPKRQADYAKRCGSFKGTGDGKCLVQDVLSTNASSGGEFLGGDDSHSGALRTDLKWPTIVTFLSLALAFGML